MLPQFRRQKVYFRNAFERCFRPKKPVLRQSEKLKKRMAVKSLFCLILTSILFFAYIIFCLAISSRFMKDLEELDSLEDLSDEKFDALDASSFESLRRKAEKVEGLLGKLKRSPNCRFECKPAVDLHYSGSLPGNLKEASSQHKILITHCLHCLQSKGYLLKMKERRRKKRDLKAQMTTPSSKIFQIVRTYPRRDFESGEDQEPSKFKIKRNKKTKSFKVPKEKIVIKDDEDYENEYKDEYDKGVPDLEKVFEITEDLVTKFLTGVFVLVAIFFMVVFPIYSFLRMCCKHYGVNRSIVQSFLTCKDTRYPLVREKCITSNVPIPEYSKYKKLMKFYIKKDKETRNFERTMEKANEEPETQALMSMQL